MRSAKELRLVDVLVDQATKFFRSMLLQAHPDFQRRETLAKSGCHIRAANLPCSHTARPFFQVSLAQGKSLPVMSVVLDQATSHLEGRMQPFVRVECNRIRTIQSRKLRSVARRDRGKGADTAVYMEPKAPQRSAISAIAVKSSMAPVLMVPAVAIIATGCTPSARSSAMRCCSRSRFKW